MPNLITRSLLPSAIDVAILLAVAADSRTPYAITKQVHDDQGAMVHIADRTIYKALLRLAAANFLKATPAVAPSNSQRPGPTTYYLSQRGANVLRYEQKRHYRVSRLIAERLGL